jgi:hypothetical protein
MANQPFRKASNLRRFAAPFYSFKGNEHPSPHAPASVSGSSIAATPFSEKIDEYREKNPQSRCTVTQGQKQANRHFVRKFDDRKGPFADLSLR